MKQSVMLAAALALSSPGGAEGEEIWGWNDREGVSHYTNQLESVPGAYRQTVETVARWRAPRAVPGEETARPEEPIGKFEGSVGAGASAEEAREAFQGYAEAREMQPAPAASSPPVVSVVISLPTDPTRVADPGSVLPSARPRFGGPLHRSMRTEFLRGPLPQPLFRPMRGRFIRKGGLVSPALERARR